MQSKLSCNKTALKRCTSTETLWNRQAPSLSSPDDEEIFLPKLPKSWHVDVFKGPKVSTAIGAKRYWLTISDDCIAVKIAKNSCRLWKLRWCNVWVSVTVTLSRHTYTFRLRFIRLFRQETQCRHCITKTCMFYMLSLIPGAVLKKSLTIS